MFFSLSSYSFFISETMNQNRRMIFAGQSSGILQRFLRAGINRMRRRSRVNQRVALPLLQELLGIAQHGRIRLVIGGGEVNERFAEHAAHAGVLGFFGDRVFEVVHIGEGGHAGADLLGRGETRSPAHELFGHILRFSGKDVFVEPVVQRDIVMQSAKQGHRDVGVAVDEAREHQRVFRVDVCAAFVFRFDFGARTDGNDRVAVTDDRAIIVDVPLRIHRDDRCRVMIVSACCFACRLAEREKRNDKVELCENEPSKRYYYSFFILKVNVDLYSTLMVKFYRSPSSPLI